MRPRWRMGWCTSGFAYHRLDDALRILADLGYEGVFLTPDTHHLDPFAPNVATEIARIGALLRKLDLSVVVETGARFLLDPRRKHHPGLLSADGADRRERYLRLAIGVARDLGAACVSLWSGANPDGLPPAEAAARLHAALGRLLEEAGTAGVDLAFEPEPGMVIETVAQFHELRQSLGSPKHLRLSLDCGHVLATNEGEPHEILLREKDLLACVAFEDMKRGVHEHHFFGEGDLDLPALVGALDTSGFDGVAAIELPRHAHDAPRLAERARDILRGLGVRFRG